MIVHIDLDLIQITSSHSEFYSLTNISSVHGEISSSLLFSLLIFSIAGCSSVLACENKSYLRN